MMGSGWDCSSCFHYHLFLPTFICDKWYNRFIDQFLFHFPLSIIIHGNRMLGAGRYKRKGVCVCMYVWACIWHQTSISENRAWKSRNHNGIFSVWKTLVLWLVERNGVDGSGEAILLMYQPFILRPIFHSEYWLAMWPASKKGLFLEHSNNVFPPNNTCFIRYQQLRPHYPLLRTYSA